MNEQRYKYKINTKHILLIIVLIYLEFYHIYTVDNEILRYGGLIFEIVLDYYIIFHSLFTIIVSEEYLKFENKFMFWKRLNNLNYNELDSITFKIIVKDLYRIIAVMKDGKKVKITFLGMNRNMANEIISIVKAKGFENIRIDDGF